MDESIALAPMLEEESKRKKAKAEAKAKAEEERQKAETEASARREAVEAKRARAGRSPRTGAARPPAARQRPTSLRSHGAGHNCTRCGTSCAGNRSTIFGTT